MTLLSFVPTSVCFLVVWVTSAKTPVLWLALMVGSGTRLYLTHRHVYRTTLGDIHEDGTTIDEFDALLNDDDEDDDEGPVDLEAAGLTSGRGNTGGGSRKMGGDDDVTASGKAGKKGKQSKPSKKGGKGKAQAMASGGAEGGSSITGGGYQTHSKMFQALELIAAVFAAAQAQGGDVKVLVIDDGQYMDTASWDLLRILLQAVPYGLLVVLASRPLATSTYSGM